VADSGKRPDDGGKAEWFRGRFPEGVVEMFDWPADLSDEEILERLLALNLQWAGV
jgi:hypothetical protein